MKLIKHLSQYINMIVMSATHIYVYLVNKRPPKGVGLQKHTGPELRVSAAHQVPGQTLEQRVLIADLCRKI